MMFGGSPISVAVPPMFETRISMITSGIGSTSSASASRNVIGTISSTVVRLSRNADSSAVVHRQRQHDRERPPLRDLPGPDRHPRVDAGRLRHPDDDHHPDQQAERVPVDRLDRVLLIDRLREQHEHRAQQRDLRAIDPLAGDQRQRGDEDDDRERHVRRPQGPGRRGEEVSSRGSAGSTRCVADQASRHTAAEHTPSQADHAPRRGGRRSRTPCRTESRLPARRAGKPGRRISPDPCPAPPSPLTQLLTSFPRGTP